MLIVDAQVHIWSAGPPTNPSHRQVNSYTAEECIRDMDAAGVDACILHPPGWDPNSGMISEEAAAKYPSRFAILGNFALDKPENRSLIDSWKQRPGMLGLRYAFTQPHQQNWMTDGTTDWLWPAAEKAGIPIALMASNYLPQVGQIAERHSGLKLILTITPGSATARTMPRTAIKQRCWRSPNTPTSRSSAPERPAIRASPTPTATSTNTRSRLSRPSAAAQLWGTDITRMPCSWKQCVTMFTEEMPWLKGRDLELVMGRAVCDWLGWKLPG
jgi:hypothetical protein